MKTNICNRFLVLATLLTLGFAGQTTFGMNLNQEYRNRKLMTAIGSNVALDDIKSLVQQGASVDAQDEFDGSALHYTFEHSRPVVMYYFIQQGANIDITDSEKLTVLHYATNHNNLFIIKYLIENGANTTLKSTNEGTAYDIAVDKDFTELVAYFNNIEAYRNNGDMIIETLQNELVAPNYFALAVLKQNICDIKTVFKNENVKPNLRYYLKIAQRLDKKSSESELTFLKMCLPTSKPKTENEQRAKLQHTLYKKSDSHVFTDVMIFCGTDKRKLDEDFSQNKEYKLED
jgi:hypothetical protein